MLDPITHLPMSAMSTAPVSQRQTTASPFVDYEELHQSGPYLMRSNNGMAYPHGVQDFSDGAPVPSLSNASYNSPQPSRVIFDDWHRPYIYRGENELGVWRQYVSPTECTGRTKYSLCPGQPEWLRGTHSLALSINRLPTGCHSAVTASCKYRGLEPSELETVADLLYQVSQSAAARTISYGVCLRP